MLTKNNNNDTKYDVQYAKLQCVLHLTTSELQIVLHKLHYTTLRYVPFLISTVVCMSHSQLVMQLATTKCFPIIGIVISGMKAVRRQSDRVEITWNLTTGGVTNLNLTVSVCMLLYTITSYMQA